MIGVYMNIRKKIWQCSMIILAVLFFCGACLSEPIADDELIADDEPIADDDQSIPIIKSGNLQIEFDNSLYSRVSALFNNTQIVLGSFRPTEYMNIDSTVIDTFTFKNVKQQPIADILGSGMQYVIKGSTSGIDKTVAVTVYDAFPGVAMFIVTYTNTGSAPVTINGWTNNNYSINVDALETDKPFWSFQGGSYEERPDWILPLEKGFEQKNYMGMNASDFGGGTPVVDIWRRDVGLAVGHLETHPQLVSLPVTMPMETEAQCAIMWSEGPISVAPGESYSTIRTFVTVHQGDYFASLVTYRQLMEQQGMHLPVYPEAAYEPLWCAWGYERNFSTEEVLSTLPKVKELGFGWVGLDDGWQIAEGDWDVNTKRFPQGDKDMKSFVNKIHEEGLRAKLWWAPLAADPGSELLKNHQDWLLINKEGKPQFITWWDSYYLCPAYPPVQEYTKQLIVKFMKDWGWDGLKIDGQHLNAAPPCYNPAHKHARPEEAYEGMVEFYKIMYDTAVSIKPDAVVEICPCGTGYNFFLMPYINQPVASDPESSFQIRLKGKTMKALMGPTVPYSGDHIELSDNGNDYASTIGIGAVLETKFTWPEGKEKLTPEREQVMKKWLAIYKEKMLPQGIYQGELYDIGYDVPEAHAIKKGRVMYYAFFSKSWEAQDLTLRGLEPDVTYTVFDYGNGVDYGTVQGSVATVNISFERALLLEVKPK